MKNNFIDENGEVGKGRFMEKELQRTERMAMVEAAVKKAGSIEALSAALGVSTRTISSWKAGSYIRERNFENLREFAVTGGPGPDRAAAEFEQAFYPVPYEEAELSMGGGSFVVNTQIKSYLGFRREWLQGKGKPSSMGVFRASGYSMEPTIPDPAIVLIDRSQTVPVNDKIYMIAYGDGIFLKRLRVKSGFPTHIVSDGLGTEEEIKPGEYFQIIGRCLWFAKELE